MTQMVKTNKKNKNNNNYYSSNSLVFGRWPQTKIVAKILATPSVGEPGSKCEAWGLTF